MRSKNNLPKRNSSQSDKLAALNTSPYSNKGSSPKSAKLKVKRNSPSSVKFIQRLVARSPSKSQHTKSIAVAGSPLKRQLFNQNSNKSPSFKGSPSRRRKSPSAVNSSPPKLNWVVTPNQEVKTFSGSKSSPFEDFSSPFNDVRPRSLPNYNSPVLGHRRSPRKLGLTLPRKIASPLAPRKVIPISPKENLWKPNPKKRGTFGRSSSFSANSETKTKGRKSLSKSSSIAPLASTLESEYSENSRPDFVPIIPNSNFDELFSTVDHNSLVFNDFLDIGISNNPSSSLAESNSLSDLLDAPITSHSRLNMGNGQDLNKRFDLNTDEVFGRLMPTQSAPELNGALNDDGLSSMFADSNSIPRTEVEDLYKEIMEEGTYKFNGSKKESEKIDWVANSKAGFSKEQLSTLNSQIKNTLQLTIQLTALEKALCPPKKNLSGIYFETSLSQLTQSCEKSKQRYGNASVANIPGLERVSSAIKIMPTGSNHLFAQQVQTTKEMETKKKPVVPLPKNIEKVLQLFKDEFNQELLPKLIPTTRKDKKTSFLAVEDDLLLQGVIFYGEKDFASIQAHCLPGKTIAQISCRFKNLTERNQTSSKIKDFYLMPFKPMTYSEKFWLRHGILIYGINFKKAIPIIFPHIPFPLIEAAWNDLYRIGQVPIKWDSVDEQSSLVSKPPLGSFAGSKELFHVTPKNSISVIPSKENPGSLVSQSSPIVPSIPSRGVSRGGNKKRLRVDKDLLIDSSKKKLRQKMHDPRRLDPDAIKLGTTNAVEIDIAELFPDPVGLGFDPEAGVPLAPVEEGRVNGVFALEK